MAHAIPETRAWIVGGPLLAGAQWTVIFNGAVVVLGSAWFFTRLPQLRRSVRPIYQELGIIPSAKEMAAEQVHS
jgi:hypothetical protein